MSVQAPGDYRAALIDRFCPKSGLDFRGKVGTGLLLANSFAKSRRVWPKCRRVTGLGETERNKIVIDCGRAWQPGALPNGSWGCQVFREQSPRAFESGGGGVYLRVVTGLAVEIERLDVLRPEADLRHFVEPRLDLALEFRLVARRTRLVERPSGRHVLADIESVYMNKKFKKKKNRSAPFIAASASTLKSA